MNLDCLIQGGQVYVKNQGLIKASVGIKDGKIAKVYREGELVDRTSAIIDATGKVVLPGVIDAHTHITMGDSPNPYLTETKSAALGGVTTALTYLFQSNDYENLYTRDLNEVQTQSYIDVAFHLGLVSDVQIDNIQKYYNKYGVNSYKFFMSFKGEEGAYLGIKGIDDGIMYDVFKTVAELPQGLLAVHPENIEVIWRLRDQLKEEVESLELWTKSRNDFTEAESILRALYFAMETNLRLYIPHVTSAKALKECELFKQRYDNFYVETCTHYLTKTCLDDLGAVGKVNPPLRYEADIEALWTGIKSGLIQVVGSDHVPRTKKHKEGGIWKASAGFPGLSTLLPIMLSEGYHKRNLSLQRVVEVLCENPAQIFGLGEKKGQIQVGFDADLVLVDLHLEKEVKHTEAGSYCDYSIFEGMSLKGWPTTTIVRGNLVMQEGQIVCEPGVGEYISRGKEGVYQ